MAIGRFEKEEEWSARRASRDIIRVFSQDAYGKELAGSACSRLSFLFLFTSE